MLSGPSALSDVDGRIDPVSTTGFSLLTTRLRKYAVSSIVSVPCVTAMPSTSGLARSALISTASFTQISSFMSWLPTEDTWMPRTSANVFICGTAAISVSTATAPDLYPAAVVDSAAPAIVPPVATMTMRGFRAWADGPAERIAIAVVRQSAFFMTIPLLPGRLDGDFVEADFARRVLLEDDLVLLLVEL